MASGHQGLGGLRLVLGGNVFGWTIDRDRSFAVLDAFYARGGRMIDTAEGYSAWVPGNKGGESETIIGEWLESRGVRQEMRIATKTGAAGRAGDLRPQKLGVALAASLERLRTDYVDLYYAHRDDPETPLDEVAEGFDALVRAGKVRELGASNFKSERLALALDVAGSRGLASYTVLQNAYNLVSRRGFSVQLQQVCVDRGVAVLPYSGLASGFLSGKYRSPEDFEGAVRGAAAKQAAEGGWQALPVLDAVASETGATPAEVALAWLNAQPSIHAAIASGTSVDHVEQLCRAATLELTQDQLARLTAVSARTEELTRLPCSGSAP